WRQAGTFGFHGGSRSGGYSIPSLVGGDVQFNPSIGAADETGDRLYDDGYVNTDTGTATDGLTSNWGYNDSSQVSGDSLYLHATGIESVRSDSLTQSFAPHSRRNERGLAPFLQFEAVNQKDFYGFQPGISASLSWMPIRLNQHWSDLTLVQTRQDSQITWTDRYDLDGTGAYIPDAPYAGSSGSPGFMIGNIPDSRESTTIDLGSEEALIRNQVSTRFSADQTTFSFGPTLGCRITDTVQLRAGMGVSVHWLHWRALQKETLTATQSSGTSELARWKDSSSGDRILGGVYLQLGAEWTPKGQPWSIQGLFRGDLGQSFSEDIGPSKVSYDVDGFTTALMLRYQL
ncbi:hypothetical protein JIN85_17475, partial [Luteolibacter pohnpeiensis]